MHAHQIFFVLFLLTYKTDANVPYFVMDEEKNAQTTYHESPLTHKTFRLLMYCLMVKFTKHTFRRDLKQKSELSPKWMFQEKPNCRRSFFCASPSLNRSLVPPSSEPLQTQHLLKTPSGHMAALCIHTDALALPPPLTIWMHVCW